MKDGDWDILRLEQWPTECSAFACIESLPYYIAYVSSEYTTSSLGKKCRAAVCGKFVDHYRSLLE